MKLDKAQRNYALERIDRATAAAIAKHTITKPKHSDAEMRALLEKAGFVISSNYSLSYIQPKMTEEQQHAHDAAVQVANLAIADIKVAAQTAKDHIMLADSEQALAIIAEFTERMSN